MQVQKASDKVNNLRADLQQAEALLESATYDRDTLANHPLLRAPVEPTDQ